MNEQQKQLDNLRKWLTLTEDRISRLSEILGPDVSALASQLDSLRKLQSDLQAQQKNVDLLSNLVVIVDEGSTDNGKYHLTLPSIFSYSSWYCYYKIFLIVVYNQMEDQLVALGERWAHICQWAEERWSKLHLLLNHCNRIPDEMQKIQSWIETNETSLKQLEAEPVSEVGKVFERIKLLQVLK